MYTIFTLISNCKKSSPKPRRLNITGANEHDLTAVKDIFQDFKNCKIIADRAYSDRNLKDFLAERNVELRTPCKLSRRKKSLTEDEKTYSKAIS